MPEEVGQPSTESTTLNPSLGCKDKSLVLVPAPTMIIQVSAVSEERERSPERSNESSVSPRRPQVLRCQMEVGKVDRHLRSTFLRLKWETPSAAAGKGLCKSGKIRKWKKGGRRGAPPLIVLADSAFFSTSINLLHFHQNSQSLQSAPFNNLYTFSNTSQATIVYNNTRSSENSYKGAAFQEATSVVSDTLQSATELGVRGDPGTGGDFTSYGCEWSAETKEAVWVVDDEPTWKLTKAALVADSKSEIGPRTLAAEPS